MSESELLHPLVAGFEEGVDRADVVLLLHGWTGSPAHMRPLAMQLIETGHGVVVPRLAGHGTNERDMAETGWRDWVASAAEAAHVVDTSRSRLHVCGLSMGGLIGLLLTAAYPVVSVTTINSPISVYSRRLRFSSLMRGSDRIEAYPPDVWPEGFATEFAHQYDSSPLGTAAELYDIMRAARSYLPLVSAPALIIQSKTDETVRPKSGTYLYDHLGSVTKRLVWLERSRHVATLDAERDVIAERLIEHVASAVRIGVGRKADGPIR